MRIYLASPFFNEKERENVKIAATILRTRGFEVFVPMEHEITNGREMDHSLWAKRVFLVDENAITMSDTMVMLYYGLRGDTGTAWECGFAFAQEIPVIVVHMANEKPSLMVANGSHANIQLSDLINYDFHRLPTSEYIGEQV